MKANSPVAPIPPTVDAREPGLSPLAASRPEGQPSNATATLLVPAYFHPSGKSQASWLRLFDASTHVPLVIIVNPSSGPGLEIEKAYADVVTKETAHWTENNNLLAWLKDFN